MNPFKKMRENQKKLPYELADTLFSYDHITGIVTRKINRGNNWKAGDEVGYQDREGYFEVNVNGVHYRLHRICWLLYYGSYPKKILDHINRRKGDNRICNLRESSISYNGRNCKLDVNNKSGITGVCWHKRRSMWMASIYNRKKIIHLGYHEHRSFAAVARLRAEKKYGWESCRKESTAYLYLKENGFMK